MGVPSHWGRNEQEAKKSSFVSQKRTAATASKPGLSIVAYFRMIEILNFVTFLGMVASMRKMLR